ncbi:hypothetical protein BpHYR1_015920 [Brachionus plicatilis]|uniref:Uncharacterized protein n=1 Tax=Brachionus plicatilis TaxID=10195 RepID=A0A3M7TBY2_BRAPC|nr:hypothetical protein BpHYR1_015920 [Brachionus plicatilis]
MHENFSNSNSNLTISISSIVSKPIKKRYVKSIAKKKKSILTHKKLYNQKAKVKIIQRDVVSKLTIDIKQIDLSDSLFRKQNKNSTENENISLNDNTVLNDEKMKTNKNLSHSNNSKSSKTENKNKTPTIIEVKCDESKENYNRKVIYINHFKSESKVYEKTEKNKKRITSYKSMENLESKETQCSKDNSKKVVMNKKDFISSVILNFKDPFYKSLFFPDKETDDCTKSKNLRDAYLALA